MGMAPQSSDTEPDPFASGDETMRDVRTCEVLHEARADFHNALVEGSAIKDLHCVAQLRQEPAYQMAEFFYLLRAFRLDGEEKIRRYVELHNRHLEALQEDRAKMRRLGLSPTRVRKGSFSQANVPKLVENYRTGDAATDQSDLSRFLIEVMLPETSRKTAVTLTEAGYLERRRSPYQSVLVTTVNPPKRPWTCCASSGRRQRRNSTVAGALRVTQIAVRNAQWLDQGSARPPTVQYAVPGQGARGMELGVSGAERHASATASGGVRAPAHRTNTGVSPASGPEARHMERQAGRPVPEFGVNT